ncbi:MFS transporter [Flavobacterium sp. SUN052]|uniref:MFS transporter n=1 Tax=Flavobacterium sp. SUN052 TaxID=3002441 RepID=UPI00237E60C4|nr:MFS transporter [Flavobacterium sp. SUN052]MEC4003208.1 MFS transporter [Flavobacterium sp. SUN052]
MKNSTIKLAMYLNYFVFAILLNSVGTIILQVQRNFDITKSNASVLEGFKDLPIAITSFILASFLPKIGLKKSMLIGLAFVTIMCAIMPSSNDFWYFKLLFLTIGVSFALIKVSVFATIGIITKSQKEHGSFMSFLEAIFMAGVLLGNIFISQFIDDANPKSREWLTIYWYLSGISLLAFLLLFFTKLDESEAKIEARSFVSDFKEMILLIIKPLTIVFILSIFFYVMLEQSFSTWFPTFYQEILKAPSSMAIQAGAILAGATFIGRLVSGFVLLRVKWIHFLSFCLIIVGAIVLIVLPMAGVTKASSETMTWLNAPLVVYLMPIMGLFLAPIYPTINSTILSALPKHQHSSMSGLIVVFSALGGTTGSIITGHVFQAFDGKTAFYFSLIPITLIFVSIWILYKMNKKNVEITA